jgi:tetratricopeptide (TPR) repeat protein
MTATDALQENIKRYEQYANVDPRNASLQTQLGELYHQAGRFDEALSTFERCLAIEPGNAAARSRIANVLISQHRFGDAEKLLSAMLAAGDSNPALLHNLGLAVYFQHRWTDARKFFSDAAKGGLKVASNFAYLSRTLHHLGEMPEAIAACERWAALSSDTHSKGYLALLHMDNDNLAAAGKIANEVLSQDPGNVDANVVAGSAAMEVQDAERARVCFSTAINKDPENGRGWLGMGLVHLYDQELLDAARALENAVRIFPDNVGIAVTLGWAHITAQDPASAEKVFGKALLVDRTFCESHAGLAVALALQNKLEQAQTELTLAKRLNPESIGASMAETFILAAQGKQQQAGDVFGNLMKRSPQAGAPSLIEHLNTYATKKARSAKHRDQHGQDFNS